MKKKLLILSLLFFFSCKSPQLVDSYRNENFNHPQLNKLMVIGMTPNEKARTKFERRLVKELKKEHIDAVASIDILERPYSKITKSEAELEEMEDHLASMGIKTVLLSKVRAVKREVSLGQAIKNLKGDFRNFKKDYYSNQSLYNDNGIGQDETNTIYKTETSLYSINTGMKKELIWRASIDLTNPKDLKKVVDPYVRIVIDALKTEHIL